MEEMDFSRRLSFSRKKILEIFEYQVSMFVYNQWNNIFILMASLVTMNLVFVTQRDEIVGGQNDPSTMIIASIDEKHEPKVHFYQQLNEAIISPYLICRILQIAFNTCSICC
jgi:hypothetical protein